MACSVFRRPGSSRKHTLAIAVAVVLSAVATSRADAQLVCAGGTNADPCVIATSQSFTNSGVATFDLGGRALVIASGGKIKVTPGGMNLLARSIQVQSGGSIVATGANGVAGSITATTTGDLRVDTGGLVDASASVSAGQIVAHAGGLVQIDGIVSA
jgi:hypothetical protein